MTLAVSFPNELPQGYGWIADEPTFDPDIHLQLEGPSSITTLKELGYSNEEIAPTATPMAVSAPFRVLSNRGAETLLEVARNLRIHQRRAGNRIENTVRGGCYRSRWLRDLCFNPDFAELMSAIFGTPVAPHTMPVHVGHINYEPTAKPDQPVDKWHHDTVALDYVMMVSDPTKLPGGQFEWFHGTKHEAAEMAARGETPPRERVVTPEFAGPGYAVALHGNMVVHRGAELTAPAERITMVSGYVSLDRNRDDQTRTRDLIGIDDPEVLYTEWSRHAAWRATGRLNQLVETLEFGIDAETAAAELEEAIIDVTRAIDDMRAGPRPALHYE